MNVMIFGATGMVGQGALRECLLDPQVERVLVIGRTPIAQTHEKLHEIVHKDLFEYASIAPQLTGYDACFFCLGVSSSGMSEDAYTRITHDLALAAAQTLVTLNPQMTFVFISGGGTDASEKGRIMWARVKGKTENDLAKLPFKAVYSLRPAFIEPLHGITSKTRAYRVLYKVLWPLVGVLKLLAPGYVTSTERVGRAMLIIAKRGAAKKVLENRDINAIA